jgi:hypothetical protein
LAISAFELLIGIVAEQREGYAFGNLPGLILTLMELRSRQDLNLRLLP